MVKKPDYSDQPVMRFGVATAVAVVLAYMLLVLYGLDVLDHILRPVFHAYRTMGLR
jgi:hypothetical protein